MNPGRFREYAKQWRAVHPETSRLYSRRHYDRHRTAERDRSLKWYHANRERVREYQRTSEIHREGHRLRQSKRRAVFREVTQGHFTREDWRSTLAYFGHRCAYCLRPSKKLTQDHVVPLSRGGPHSADNIVPACKSCNSRKHQKTPLEALAC